MDYKNSLNLPNNRLAMKANLTEKEAYYQNKWETEKIYEQILNNNKDNKSFILHDGPPYANGNLHVGHALNKILKDFIVRFHAMNGKYTPFVPGWDTHGLPIENKMIEINKINRKEIEATKFRQMCEEFALEQIEIQKQQFKKMGSLGDYASPYVTLDPIYEAMQLRIFGKMIKNKVIYKGKKTVIWSPSSESALAEAEIEYYNKKSKSIYVAFKIKTKTNLIPENTSFIIWTTTPWTIPANLAIAVNAQINYGIYETTKFGTIIVAQELEETLMNELNLEQMNLIKVVKGAQLEHLVASHPLYERDSKIILGDHVTVEAGTGLVHTAPGHGEDDYFVGQKYGLEIFCPIDEQGKYTKEVNDPLLEGVYYEKANNLIIERLMAVNALVSQKEIEHAYAHDWRTKKPIIYRATSQWFASVEQIKDQILTEIDKVEFPADWAKVRLVNMIKDRKDWCISRQRIWGVPIPIFYTEDNQPILDEKLIEHVANIVEKEGTNVWYQKEAKELLPNNYTHPASPNGIFKKETDIMDVWFDSGSSHTSVLQTRPELSFPADLYLEGSDQYRGWFNSSLINSVAYNNQAPYRQLLSHGFVLDGNGRKMSKSIGNVIDPLKVIEKHGADILRLWVATSNYSEDVRISDEIIEQTKKTFMKIRNTIRFIEGNLADFSTNDAVEYDELSYMDKYVYNLTNELNNKVLENYEKYHFINVVKNISNFCIVDLSAFYLNYTKDILYVDAINAKTRRSVQTVYEHILRTLTKLIAPILIHTAEDINQTIYNKSIMLEQFGQNLAVDTKLINNASKFLDIRDAVNKKLEEARKEKLIKTTNEVIITITVPSEYDEVLENIDVPLTQLLSVAKVEIKSDEQLTVEYEISNYEKCERCWNYTNDVENNICQRCYNVINEKTN